MEFTSLESFEKLLYDLSKQPGYKPKKGERKGGSPLITPSSFQQGTTRANRNVTQWNGWAALDVDDYDGSFEETIEKFKKNYFICYSSASSTKEKPKFRVILPLTSSVPAEKIRHFWYALNHEFGSVGDAQTKDLSRMYYVPAQYPNAYNFIFTNKAPLLDPVELMERHSFVNGFKSTFEDRMPEHIREKIAEYKKDKLTNTNVHWSSYRDCPFVNKQLVSEYRTITDTGWYAKMYQIMTSIAMRALRSKYPITPDQIARLCKEIDAETGGWYKNRPMTLESARAIDYSMKNI
jgi:hypothetical protein